MKQKKPPPAAADGTTGLPSVPRDSAEPGVPLAERMRPRTLQEFVGQEHLVGPEKFLVRAVESGALPSMILWGPPGTGKTTVARIVAGMVNAEFVQFSAVPGGVKEIREIVAGADQVRRMFKKPTIFFIDEIHRFNKAQQDALLPHVEDGTVTLIGATTENPYFEVIGAVARKVLVLKALGEEDLKAIIPAAPPTWSAGSGACGDGRRRRPRVHGGGGVRRRAPGAQHARGRAGGEERAVDPLAEEAVQHRAPSTTRRGGALQRRLCVHQEHARERPRRRDLLMVRVRGGGGAALHHPADDHSPEDVGNADPQAIQVAARCSRSVSSSRGVLLMTGAPRTSPPPPRATRHQGVRCRAARRGERARCRSRLPATRRRS